MSRALVIGASGYLGVELLRALGPRGIGTFATRPRPGLLPFDAARERLDGLIARAGGGVTRVFLPLGWTDPERCARDPEGSRAVNVSAMLRLIDDAFAAGLTPVFCSSDHVFDGARGGYREDDAPAPLTLYGAQKLEVERRLAAEPAPWIAARMSKLVGTETDRRSVIGQHLAEIAAGRPQRCAVDQVLSPAWVVDAARALVALADRGATGVWHVAGPEPMSRLALVEMILEEMRAVDPSLEADLIPCRLNDLQFSERRPLDTSLDVSKLAAALDWRFRPMRDLCREAAEKAYAGRMGR